MTSSTVSREKCLARVREAGGGQRIGHADGGMVQARRPGSCRATGRPAGRQVAGWTVARSFAGAQARGGGCRTRTEELLRSDDKAAIDPHGAAEGRRKTLDRSTVNTAPESALPSAPLRLRLWSSLPEIEARACVGVGALGRGEEAAATRVCRVSETSFCVVDVAGGYAV